MQVFHVLHALQMANAATVQAKMCVVKLVATGGMVAAREAQTAGAHQVAPEQHPTVAVMVGVEAVVGVRSALIS